MGDISPPPSFTLPSVAAIIGGGVIGSGWTARLVLNGVDVALYDPHPQTGALAHRVVDAARAAWSRLLADVTPLPQEGSLRIVSSLEAAVRDATYVQENVPEDILIKSHVLRSIGEAAPPDALVCSSTSGILPTVLQEHLTHPQRFVVAHPFNPVYLLPLVEVVGGAQTAAATIVRAKALFSALGMHPLHVRVEIEAFLADRLMEALWREALWLLHDGIATAEEIDDAVRFGCGLRWAQMGTFQTFALAGGKGGIRHMLKQFGPCLQWPWSKLTDVPELDDAFVDTIAAQCESQTGGKTQEELEYLRDTNLVAILQALRGTRWGGGDTYNALAQRLGAIAPDQKDQNAPALKE